MFGKTHNEGTSPNSSDNEKEIGVNNGGNVYDPNLASHHGQDINTDNAVCPSSTTEAKLMRKIDLRVIPFLCILYLLAFLDRVNIANARAFRLAEDLNLKKTDYNTALTIFFVPYIIFEIPSNMVLKRFNPNVWLSGCMFMFGAVSIAQGLVRNYSGLLATRFFLGFFEAPMFPACFYLVGSWYKRAEAQRRYTFFFSSTTLAGAFGGLLASAIGKMQGLRGYNGWRWIFILEGVLTCVVAIIFFFYIPNFPEQAKWLTPEEREFVKARLRVDQGPSAAERPIGIRDIGRVFKDYKVILGGFMYFFMLVPAYGYAFFAPSIVKTFGYSPIQTQLYSVPPWACAFVFAMIIAFASDLTKHRFAFTIIPISVAAAGFAILLAVHNNNKVQYFGMFLVAMGAYSSMPVIVCWFNMNLGGHHRRSIGTAWQIGFGNIGGIIAPYAFLDTDAPRYMKGYAICFAFLCCAGLTCCAYAIAVSAANRKRDKMAVDVGLTEHEKTELGDMSPDYRYLL